MGAPRPRVCVLSGGPSLEAPASRVSAAGVHAALAEAAYEVTWLDLPARDGEEGLASLLRSSAPGVVFPVIPGALGEDGRVQALCESLSIPWVGCDAAATLACYDKALFKRLMRAAGLPVARHLAVERREWERSPDSIAARVERELGYPCIVKPSKSGSSLGLSRVEDGGGLGAAIAGALEFDREVLVEDLFVGADVEIGVFENGSLLVGDPVELEFEGPLYDFEAKYVRSDRRHLPARCESHLIERLRRAASSAFRAARCSGMARVDLLVDLARETFVVNEINTIPYMPASSTFTGSICHRSGKSYGELIAAIVQSAGSARRSPAAGAVRRRGSRKPAPEHAGSRA